MAAWRDLGNIWTTFKELDIRPIREEAERPTVLAVVGASEVGKSALVAALRHDARASGHEKVISPTIEAGLDAAESVGDADLIILVLDAARREFDREAALYREWTKSGRKVLVFYNKMDTVQGSNTFSMTNWAWNGSVVSFGSALDPGSLSTDLIPKALSLLPDRHLSVSRHYPVFRMAVSRELIGETSAANATYALGTGLAEVIPALDIPFNIADVVVLTKNQALMVYKLGLALGLSVRWQDHVTELGGVVGAGFVWRQIARQLVGLIPVWGIIPKVAVAYAGTYAVGQAVLYWYQTGRKISTSGMHQLYVDALAQGRQVATSLIARRPRPSLPRVGTRSLPPPKEKNACPNCGRENAQDARYCAYCATPLAT